MTPRSGPVGWLAPLVPASSPAMGWRGSERSGNESEDEPMDRPEIERVAESMVEAADRALLVEPLSSRHPGFSDDDAWAVARAMLARREADGWRPVGRKIGFTNRTIWPRYGVFAPIWAHVYDRTVQFALRGQATVALGAMVQPRLEPEIALRFRASPASAEPAALLEAIDWVAASFELVQCHFPDWRFRAADTIADGGLHGALVVGTPVPVTDFAREQWLRGLAAAEVALYRGPDRVDTGTAANVLGGPLHALAHLCETLRGQPESAPIAAGEIVTTGTITDAHPVAPGQTWHSSYFGVPLAGLTVAFAP